MVAEGTDGARVVSDREDVPVLLERRTIRLDRRAHVVAEGLRIGASSPGGFARLALHRIGQPRRHQRSEVRHHVVDQEVLFSVHPHTQDVEVRRNGVGKLIWPAGGTNLLAEDGVTPAYQGLFEVWPGAVDAYRAHQACIDAIRDGQLVTASTAE